MALQASSIKAVSKVEHMTVAAAGDLIWAEGDNVGPVKLRPYRSAAKLPHTGLQDTLKLPQGAHIRPAGSINRLCLVNTRNFKLIFYGQILYPAQFFRLALSISDHDILQF